MKMKDFLANELQNRRKNRIIKLSILILHFYNVYMKNRIKSLRIEKGLSQTELSEQIGCTQQSLSKIENGIQIPGVDLAFKIADFLM